MELQLYLDVFCFGVSVGFAGYVLLSLLGYGIHKAFSLINL